jgi:thiamine kinase-like enzyme
MTIVHGDAHVWNCFLPNAGTAGTPKLFDWDGWRLDYATDDLAYQMALHWYPALRREREQHLLDVYHGELEQRGVTGYDRRALQDDYRLSVLWTCMTPVWQHAAGIPAWIWWSHLARIHLAVEDLRCRELVG